MAGSRRTYYLGIWAEWLAAAYLCFKGYRILERRYKTPMGEVDIIARKGHVIVFCEVKWRSSHDGALLAVHGRNRARVMQAARFFMAKLDRGKGVFLDFRFDIIAVSPFFRIRHLDNAWGETP